MFTAPVRMEVAMGPVDKVRTMRSFIPFDLSNANEGRVAMLVDVGFALSEAQLGSAPRQGDLTRFYDVWSGALYQGLTWATHEPGARPPGVDGNQRSMSPTQVGQARA